MLLKKGWIIAPLMLAACSGDADEEKEQIDYASFDDAALSMLFSRGDYQQVLEIVRGQEDLDIANKADHMMAARIHTLQLNGIAAEVALEKAMDAGAEPEEIAILLARSYLLQSKYQRAERILKETVLLEEDAYEALLLRGDISKEVGEVGDARSFYEAAIQDNPEAFRGYIGLALLELFAGRLDEAERLSALAAEKSGPDPIVYYVRGVTARYQQDIEIAKSFLQKAAELNQSHVMAHLELVGIHVEEGNMDAAEKSLDAVFAINPQHSMAQYYSALILASKGETDKAEEILLHLGDLTLQYPPAARVYGHVAYRLGKFTTAQPYLQRFLTLVPGDRATRLALAESLTRRGRAKQALVFLDPLIAGESTDLEAFLQAAAAAGLLGEVRLAKGYLSTAEKLAEGREVDQELVRSLARRLALARFMTGEAEQALAQLRSMYSADEDDFVSLTLLANMQMQTGKLGAAEETVEKLITQAPDNPLGLNLLGAIRHRQQKPEEAIEHYNAALQLNSFYVSALKNRALSYLALEKVEEARLDLEEVLIKTPDDAHARGMLGRAYTALGRANEAVPHLQKAEKAYPRSAIVATDLSQALAAMNYTSSAIAKAKEARQLAANDTGLVAYIDTLIGGWQVTIQEERKAKQTAEEERRKARDEAEKERQAAAEEERLKEAERQAQEGEASPGEDGADQPAEPEGEPTPA